MEKVAFFMTQSSLKVMMVGAHPDDCDISTYAITSRMVKAGCSVCFVSMTNGNAGHQTMRGEELAAVRAKEAKASADLLGVDYQILPFDDGRLTPSLEAREALIRLIRRFSPNVIFTNRPCDYHPDHRAAAQLVVDSSYLLGVPAICQDTPPLRFTPTILYWHDNFTDPKPFRPDYARPADQERELLFQIECCHASQFLDWLPWADDRVDLTGKSQEEREAYVRDKLNGQGEAVDELVRQCLIRQYGEEIGNRVRFAESWLVSEYGAPVSGELRELLIGL
jgi:LmbE family N-acetylglucosaminyl deacetylase